MWNDTDTPLAYFISFRSYSTWLHGDQRGSIDRFHNRYGDPYLPPNEAWQHHNRKQLKTTPFTLGARERGSVEKAIRDTCRIRSWDLKALNVRTNHVYTVVTANRKSSLVLNALQMQLDNLEKTSYGHTRLVRGLTRAAKESCGMSAASQMRLTMCSMVRAMNCQSLMSEREATYPPATARWD